MSVDEVDLGQHDHHFHVVLVETVLHLPNRGVEATEQLVSVVAGVRHEQEQIALQRLGQGGAEGLERLARKGIDEPDGVGQQHTWTGLHATDGGLKRGEQAVLDEHGFSGQGAEEARLSCVRVARKTDRPRTAAGALPASLGLRPSVALQALTKALDLSSQGHQHFRCARCTRTTVSGALPRGFL